MSNTTLVENTRNPVEDRSVIIIEDDSETEGQILPTAQGSPRGSMSSVNGLANGTSTSKLDVDPPRTPTTTGGELPTSASTSPTPRPNTIPNTLVDPNGDAIMIQDPSQKPRVSTTGPKQTKPKEDSPVPQLPPRPPQQPTVRLEFFIDDPEEYEINVLELAKGAGQRLPTPPPPEKDSSDSEEDDEPPEPHPLPMPDAMADAPAPTFRRRKRRNRDYDLDDPFIDDIDLAKDERTHIAQTMLQGFYVSAGDVDLVAQSSPPPASKRGPGRPPKRAAGPVNATLIARTLLSNPLGNLRLEGITAQAAIAASLELGSSTNNGSPVLGMQDLDMVGANGNDRKRKASPDIDDPKKKRKTDADAQPFHPDLEGALANLKEAVSKHDFTYKGKFPPDLKPLLLETAIKAICLGDYNDSFFNYLPKIFPYNRFTMFKLTKRLVYKDHIRLIHERQTALLEELAKQVNEGMDSAKAEYERNVILWEEKRARKKADESLVKGGTGMEGVELTSLPPPPVAAPILDEHKEHGDGEGDEGEDDKDKPPTTRYRLNETMRGYLWALVQLSNEVCILTNEKNNLEGSKEIVSEQSQRKELYKKIMQAFPDGWMNTGTISREVSMMKKKMETATAPKTEEGTAIPAPPPTMSVMPAVSAAPS